MLFKLKKISLPSPHTKFGLNKNMSNYNRFHVNCYLKATCNMLSKHMLKIIIIFFYFYLIYWKIYKSKLLKLPWKEVEHICGKTIPALINITKYVIKLFIKFFYFLCCCHSPVLFLCCCHSPMLLLFFPGFLQPSLNVYLFIRNLKYAYLTPAFRLHSIYLEFFTCPHRFKWLLCTEKSVSKASFQDFWCKNIKPIFNTNFSTKK